MTKERTNENRITLNLAGAGLGAVLLAAPWLSRADSASACVAGAVFLGALLVRLGLSSAVRPRTWKARARLAVGASTIAIACVTSSGGATLPLGLLYAVGLITVALAATELRLGGDSTARTAAAHRRVLRSSFVPSRWGQPC